MVLIVGEILELFIESMKLNINTAREANLELGKDYTREDEGHRTEWVYQKALNEQAINLIGEMLIRVQHDLPISSFYSIKRVIEEAGRLLGKSRYGEVMRERVKELGELEREIELSP